MPALLNIVFRDVPDAQQQVDAHVKLLLDEGIDYEALSLMREDHFRELGIKMGVRVRILEALRSQSPQSPQSSQPPAQSQDT